MLILSRKTNESIVINDNIKITYLGTVRNQIRLGIEAPKDIPVHRSEIQERINDQAQKFYVSE